MQRYSSIGASPYEALIVSCAERVKVIASWFAWSSDGRVEADEMYSIGMLEICEAVAAGRLANALNPVGYLVGVARLAMIEEWWWLYRWSCASLDAPLSSESDGSLTLYNVLPAPASSAPILLKYSQALGGTLRRLTARQRAVLRRRYALPGYGSHSLKETASSLGTSVYSVDHASRKGMKRLRVDVRLRKVMEVAQ